MKNVDDVIEHYGVKGMRWGHRKNNSANKVYIKSRTESQSIKLKNGETLTMKGEPTPLIAKFLARYIPAIRHNINNTANFTLTRPSGKNIGELTIFKESPTTLNAMWLEIDKNERGKGYASAIVKGAKEYAKKEGVKKITLEVPGNAPDARHIYEKHGFKVGETFTDKNDAWGGLTRMHLDV